MPNQYSDNAVKQQEVKRWQQTLNALASSPQGKVVGVREVHRWLNSWGEENELSPLKVGE